MLGLGSWPDPGPFRSERASAPSRALPASAGGITEGRYTPTKSRNPTLRRLWRLLRTAIRPRPSSPRFRGSIEMAVIRHRGKLIPIIGHRNGSPVSVPPDYRDRASCRTAVRPISPRVREGVDMAAPRHRGKLIPIIGHRNGIPVFILVCVPRDSPIPRFIQVAPEFEGNPKFIKEPTHLSQ